MNISNNDKTLTWAKKIISVAFLGVYLVACQDVESVEQTGSKSSLAATVKEDPELGVPVCRANSQLTPVSPGDWDVERFEFDVSQDENTLPGVGYFPQGQSAAPTVLMLNGGSIEGSRYDWLGEFLASNGFAVVMMKRNAGGDRLGLPMAMLNAVGTAGFEERINPDQVILAGHSFGGLNALCLASPDGCPWEVTPDQVPTGLRGVITLMSHAQPFEEPDMSTPMPIDGIPVMMIQGTRDGRSTVDEVTATFERLEGQIERYLVTLTGVNHYQMASCLDLNRDNYREELVAEVSHMVALERVAKAILSFAHWLNGGDAVMNSLMDDEGILVEMR